MIALLPEQEGLNELGGTMRLGNYTADLREGTLAMNLYKEKQIVERHRHRYEVNPQYIRDLEKAGLVFSATNKNRMECLESRITRSSLPRSSTRSSSPGRPTRHRRILGFVEACRANKRTNLERKYHGQYGEIYQPSRLRRSRPPPGMTRWSWPSPGVLTVRSVLPLRPCNR